MSEVIKEININDIFKDKYIIPIYQRKYAWTDKEIEQLLEDITGTHGKYYLGTLVVNENNGKYEVIDGQQRLTTLYLLMLYLKKEKCETIEFEARKNYDKALADLKNYNASDIAELNNGYNCIENYFREHKNKKFKFVEINTETNDCVESEVTIKEWVKDRLNNVCIVRVHVPEDTDLNNYFEVMNTRGEQLELHYIAKARFIAKITSSEDKKIVSAIWDACANMSSYVQKNFKKSVRDDLFLNDLSEFAKDLEKKPASINDAWQKLANKFNNINSVIDAIPLENIINGNIEESVESDRESDKNIEKDDNYRFASIIPFPYFLLYVNAILLESGENIENLYDDKKLLINLDIHLKDEESVKNFIYHMLQCRFLFDKYIIKRDSRDNDDNSELVLKKYKKYDNSTNFVDTFSGEEKSDGYTQNRLVILQSMLRITYTSPRNMQWITELLKHLLYKDDNSLSRITNLLEEYCINKLKEADIGNLKEKRYPNIERIIFTYLDYLLYRDGYKEILKPRAEWKTYFRNSVEHFYPQHPDNDVWEEEYLHCFGNLALVTTSDNSRFSNLYPEAKIDQYKNIIEQSLKLKIMADYIKNDNKWSKDKVKEHQEEMFKILENEINKKA